MCFYRPTRNVRNVWKKRGRRSRERVLCTRWACQCCGVHAQGEVLASGNFRHLAIADPRLAPYGAAAEEIMRKRGVFSSMDEAGKLVRGQSIGQTYSQVASDAADLGFVALSQIKTGDGIAG